MFTHTYVCRADVSLRDVTIAQDGKRGLASVNDVTHPKHTGDFGNLKKVSRVENWTLNEMVDFRLLAEVRPEALGRCCTRWGGGRWKSQNRKIVPLSPYVEEHLNSKVIKSFLPEQRSRKCFSCFKIPMGYVFYLYGHSMYVSHIAISWLWFMYIIFD